MGLIITAILVVNNLRDLENDRKAGKHTLAVMLARGARIEYVLCVVSAYFVVPVFDPDKYHSCVFIVDVVVVPLAWKTLRVAFTQEGRPLTPRSGTGQIAFAYSVLFWIGVRWP